jgi:hypothetical protein
MCSSRSFVSLRLTQEHEKIRSQKSRAKAQKRREPQTMSLPFLSASASPREIPFPGVFGAERERGRRTGKKRERGNKPNAGTVPLTKRATGRPARSSPREADPYPRKSDSGRNRAHSPSLGKRSKRFRISLSNEKCTAKQYDTERNPCQGKRETEDSRLKSQDSRLKPKAYSLKPAA